jgi:hypothetical protein
MHFIYTIQNNESNYVHHNQKNTSLEETWRYHGRLIQRGSNYIVIEAYFDREDMEFNGMTLLKGDRFQATYFTDKWF